MKKRQWLNRNHMLFESDCKMFNKQCDLYFVDKEKEKEELVNLMELMDAVIEENREALEKLGS